MPIIVKDFSWRQTSDTIIIRVPCNSEHMKDVDVVSSDNYIKASYPPYILELFLFKEIKDSESTCIRSDSEIIFNLVKKEGDHWEFLEKALNKTQKKELRDIIYKDNEIKINKDLKEKAEKKAELHRKAVRHQIKLDDIARKKVEEMKNFERQKMAKEISNLKEISSLEKQGQSTKCIREQNTEIRNKFKATQNKIERIPKDDSIVKLPSPRAATTIQVKFSERKFPTPSRESKAAEEEEWLRKQAHARKMAGFDDSELSMEERDPTWLKEKGDSFFRLGNYQGAVAAYTHGIKLSNQMPALYSNRSAAHIALGNFHKALEDSSIALDLLNPKTSSNATARASCHTKRGATLWKLGLLEKGLIEFRAARDLIKFHDKESNYLKTLEEDILKISSQIEENCDEDESDNEN